MYTGLGNSYQYTRVIIDNQTHEKKIHTAAKGHGSLKGASAKVAFVHEHLKFRAKNRRCDDVYLQGKRRSRCGFVAEI